MRCRECGFEVTDADAAFCARCGAALGPADAERTDRLDAKTGSRTVEDRRRAATRSAARLGDTTRQSARSGGGAQRAARIGAGARRVFQAGGWPGAVQAATFGFLAVLAVGALFVGTLKIYSPSFGAGRSPVWVLTRIVIAGLASLGVPVEQARAEGSIVPLGALAGIGWALTWAARNVVATGAARPAGERAAAGAKAGVPFGLMCMVAALIFRVRDGVEVGALPSVALVFGAGWGALFGAAGGLAAGVPGAELLRSVDPGRGRRPGLTEGLRAGVTMLGAGGVLAAALALMILIWELARARGVALSGGDAVALVFLMVVFAPNIVIGTLGFSLGAPVGFVAKTLAAGIGTEISLFAWGGAAPPPAAYIALLVPLGAGLYAGFAARRRTTHPRRQLEILAIAAVTFAAALALLTMLGNISLDRVFLGAGNHLVLGADAATVFVLAILWAGAAGIAGWMIADSPAARRAVRSQRTS
jgi:hypothetical protein